MRATRPSCAICGEPIDPALRYPHKRSLSVDHRTPRVNGGSDDPSNLRPTHLRCNLSRGDGHRSDPEPTSREW
jgi:5-methylcytosine-specific restriction endonuclease McrA